jgi:hypothetical protein
VKGARGHENLAPYADAGRQKARLSKTIVADAFALKLNQIIENYRLTGMNLSQIARQLNSDDILTASGKAGTWTAQGVKNILGRQCA